MSLRRDNLPLVKISIRHEQVAEALARGDKINAEIAEEFNVARVTLQLWLTRPEFIAGFTAWRTGPLCGCTTANDRLHLVQGYGVPKTGVFETQVTEFLPQPLKNRRNFS